MGELGASTDAADIAE